MAFAALVSMGGAPKASIFMGKGDNEQAEKAGKLCLDVNCIVCCVNGIYADFWKMILQLFGASDNTILYKRII